ncbi:hypothetical protein M5X04_07455 [Paenibacillus alvei]|uniref:Phage XkdN-like protein n=1 Tax=Paenibacillus alvei TaxID=44250 RepID=A0ABT4E628_PAEAL|nr:hypothetical protein [Paenibacillus alvei]MCY9529171.1 hypothetical protein [Paenibacillus alvei]
MTTNKKLTLADLVAAKLGKEKAKNKKQEFYVNSLGGTVTLETPEEGVVIKAADMLTENSLSCILESYKYLIYNSVPLFRSTELHAEYEVQDPIDIVPKLLEVNERISMGEAINKMANISGMEENIKN